MKNVNCLEGLMCPKCGQQDRFIIDAITSITLLDDGVDKYEGAEFDGSHTAGCPSCGWNGTVAELNVPSISVTFNIYTPLSLEMGEADRHGWWMPGEWLYDEYPGSDAFEFDPEYYDPEEHATVRDAIVEWACSVLERNGACHPSDEPADNARWWSTEDEVLSYAEGSTIGKQFHLNMPDDIRERVNLIMRGDVK